MTYWLLFLVWKNITQIDAVSDVVHDIEVTDVDGGINYVSYTSTTQNEVTPIEFFNNQFFMELDLIENDTVYKPANENGTEK